MSMQSKEKKRRGVAMSSTAKITKGDASEDALPTESALLGPNNPTNAGGGGQDEQEEALVIPEKAEVGEKIMYEPGVAVKRGFSATRFNGFPESPCLSASFLYGRLENQRIGSHPKILPTRFVSDFQAAALLPRATATSITRVLTQGRKDNVLPYVLPELFNTMYNGH